MHPFASRCPANGDIATKTGLRVQGHIAEAATINKQNTTHLPLWFNYGKATQNTPNVMYKPFAALAQYDKDLGAIGYIPNSLHKAMDYFRVAAKDRDKLIKKITVTIVKGAHEMWLNRCANLTKAQRWTTADQAAQDHIEKGVT
jgi:hypothetical protein